MYNQIIHSTHNYLKEDNMINIQQVAQDTFWIGGSDRRSRREDVGI